MDVDPELEFVYSGESDSPSDSKSPAKSSRETVGAGSKTAEQRGSLDPELFGSSDASKNSSPGSNRSRSYSCEASAKHEDVRPHANVDDSSRSHRIHGRSNNRYCDDRGASFHVGAHKRSMNVTHYDHLLSISH